MASNPPFRGVKLDLLSYPPAFGIPVLGHALNAFSLLPAFLTSQIPSITPEGSPALQVAQQQGLLEAWAKRSDIPEYQKMGMELASGNVVPPFATVGPGARLSKTMMAPAVGAYQKFGQALPNVPVVGGLFRVSKPGQVRAVREELGTAFQYFEKTGQTPSSVAQVMRAEKAGQVPSQLAARQLQLADPQFNLFKRYYSTLDDAEVDALLMKPNSFYDEATNLAQGKVATSLGVGASANPTSSLGRAWEKARVAQSQLMLSSGTTGVQNALDIYAKGALSGVPSETITKAMLEQIGKGDVDDYAKLVGFYRPDARLGLSVADDMFGISPEARKVFLTKMSTPQAFAVGAGVGGLSGNPINAVLGGIEMVASKYGFTYGMKLMEVLEKAARKSFMAHGAQQMLRSQDVQIAGEMAQVIGPQKAGGLMNVIRGEKYLFSPDDVYKIGGQIGLNADDIGRATNVWRNFHGPAIEQGINFSTSIHFPYTRPPAIVEAARSSIFPFAVWPMHNIPWYIGKGIERPVLPALAGSYEQKSEAERERGGLPNRFAGKLPVAGNIWANPLAWLSITSQLTSPPPPSSDQPQSVFDKTIDVLQKFGLSPYPAATMPLQALGLVNPEQSYQDITPWARFLRPAAQALTGQTYDPEAAIKAGLTGIQQQAAPGTVPDVSYQDYLIRKKLAEMSLRDTGQAWWQNPQYEMAMIDNTSPLWQQATRESGQEQASLYIGRRALPFELGYLPEEERQIRGARANLNLPPGLPGAVFGQIMERNPTAFGYRNIGDSPEALTIQIKQDYYYQLPTQSRRIFAAENPDLSAYLQWANAERRAGRKPSIDNYLQRKSTG